MLIQKPKILVSYLTIPEKWTAISATFCRSAYFHLRNIRSIRRYLSKVSTEQLIHAFVSTRLDGCNSLLYGLPASSIHKLQRVQNAAARIVTYTNRNEHITPALRTLHWLPVRYRISYKIIVLVWRCLHNTAPSYLQLLLEAYIPNGLYAHRHTIFWLYQKRPSIPAGTGPFP